MALIDQKNGDVTLAECAQELGYHPSYIWRVLKNTRDITFTDYIAEQKLRIATRLLEETELSVSEIAERLSYSNAQNFIRLFKSIWVLRLDSTESTEGKRHSSPLSKDTKNDRSPG